MATRAAAEVFEAAPAELRIQSSKVSVWKRGGRRVLLIVALAFILIAFGVSFVLVLAAGVALEIWCRVHAARWARPAPRGFWSMPGAAVRS